MIAGFQWGELSGIAEKVQEGTRLSEADASRLFASRDLNALGLLANHARKRRVGDRTSYIVNRYINYSNYCILSCQFCAFARKRRDQDGFELTIDQMLAHAREGLGLVATEVHSVGGLPTSLPFSYYLEFLRALKTLEPKLQLKCFTAIEVLHLAWLARKSVTDTLVELKGAGLYSLATVGADVL